MLINSVLRFHYSTLSRVYFSCQARCEASPITSSGQSIDPSVFFPAHDPLNYLSSPPYQTGSSTFWIIYFPNDGPLRLILITSHRDHAAAFGGLRGGHSRLRHSSCRSRRGDITNRSQGRPHRRRLFPILRILSSTVASICPARTEPPTSRGRGAPVSPPLMLPRSFLFLVSSGAARGFFVERRRTTSLFSMISRCSFLQASSTARIVRGARARQRRFAPTSPFPLIFPPSCRSRRAGFRPLSHIFGVPITKAVF